MSKSTQQRVLFMYTLAAMAKRVFLAFLVLVTLTSVYSITRAGAPVAEAAAPTTLNFQARLLNSSGSLVSDGNYSVEFKIYNANSSSGSSQGNCSGDANCLWTETRTGGNQIQIKNGYLSAYLGDVSALPTNIWNQQLWLTMNIHNGTGWDGEMTPRIRLTSVPYAFRATIAESAETLSKNTGSFTGTVDFANMTADRKFLFPDTSLATTASPGTICVYNGAASNCPAASGSAYYLQNDTVLQTSTNFHIQARDSGVNGTIGGVITGAAAGQTVDLLQFRASDDSTVLAAVTATGNLQIASTVDVRSAGTLGIGTSTATAITLGKAGVTTTNAGALTVSELGTFNGGLTSASNFTVTQAGNVAFQRNTTDYTATGTQDDVNFGTGALFRITSASALTITSIQGGADGRVITLANASSNTVTLQNDSGGTAANRIVTGTGDNLSVPAGSSVQLTYDSSSSRWRVIGGTATNGGGANQQLSNLSGTVAINAALTPNADNSLDLGSSGNSWKSLYADTSVLTPTVDAASAATLNLGTVTANAVSISRTGVTTTVNGALSVSEALSANAGISASGGAVSLTGNAASSLTTSAGALTITSNQAATWSTANGNLTIQAGSGVVSLGSSSSLTAAGALTITSGGANALGFDTGGAAALNIGLTNANAVSISRTGVTTTINGALTVTQLGTFNGGLTAASDFTVTNAGNVAFQRNTTDYTATGTQNDISFGTGVLFRITSASALTITSISGGADGRIITLANASANAVTIQNDSGGTAANRIITGTGNSLSVPAGATVQLAYDSSSSRWRVIGGTATNGGGANQQLSNLSGTVAVNTSLNPYDTNVIDLGSSNYSWRTLYADTSVLTPRVDTDGAATLLLGNINATAVTLGHSGITTTNAGAFTASELLTANAGITASGGALSLTGNAASSLTTSSGALTITSAAAATWSTATGNLTVDSAATLQLGTANATGVSISKTGVTTTVNGALTVTQAGTFNGGLTAASDFTVTNAGNVAFQRNTTDFTTTGTSNDVNFGTGVIFRINGASAQTITSIQGGTDGRVITIINAGANSAIFNNDNCTGCTASNKIITGTNGALSLPPGGSILLGYDTAASRWRIIGGSAVSGGGANRQLNNLQGTVAVNASLTTGADNTIDLGSSSFSWRTLYADTSVLTPRVDTDSATTLLIGDTTANAVSISRTGVTTTVNGALTVSQALSANAGISASGGAVSLTGNAASSLTTSSGALTITSAAAATWSTSAGNLTIQAGSGVVSLGTSTSLTASGALAITSGGANALGFDAGGAASINIGLTNANAVSISRTGVTTTVNGALTVTQAGTFNGGLTAASDFTVTNAGNVAFQRNTTDFTATGTQNDISLGTGVLFRLNGATAQTITSIQGGTDGRVITLVNAGANAATIQNDSGGTAANRIITGTGGDLSVPSGASIQLAYDSSASRWRIIGGSAVSGGGANQQLSNLSGTVAVNANLTPTGDNGIDLGTTANSWRTLYADTSVLTSRIDRAAAATLNIGTVTANAISVSKSGVTTTINGALTVTEAGTFNGGLTVASNFSVTNAGNVAFQRNTTDYTATGTQNDVNLGTGVLFRITSASALTITSITGGADGRIITLVNASANTVILQNDSGGTAANRIITGTGGDFSMGAGSTAQLAYDSSSSRWRVIGGSALAGVGANQQLSNLSGTIAVNASLTPNGDNSLDLGSSSFSWRTIYADTSVLTALIDTPSATALNIGTTNATQINLNKDTVVTGNVTLAQGANRTLSVAARSTAGVGYNLTVAAGAANGSNNAGGALLLQGGAAVAGNANGGAVTISGGAGVGTGTQGLVNLATSAFTSASEQAFTSSTSITAGNVDLYSTLPVKANTNLGSVLTVPDPAQNVIGRLLYISARSGSLDFTMRLNSSRTPIDIAMKANSTATLIWNGTDWTAAGASSSTDLQSAYNNTLTSAGGAEIVLNPTGGAADGFTIRNNSTTPIVGGLLEVQTSVGSNILSVNSNATEYASNGGAETKGGSDTTFPSSTWSASATGGTQATVSRTITVGEFATGIAAAKVVTTGATTANQGIADQIAVNGTNTALTANLTYTVSFTVKGTSNFSTLDVVYSKDGTNTGVTTCATAKTVTESVWSRISCTFTAPSSGITTSNAIFIRQSDSNTSAKTFYVDNLSVNINASTNHAADGDADTAANIGGGTNNWAAVSGSTVTQSTSTIYNTAGAVSVTTAATSGRGVYNKLSNNIVPTNGTQYRVAFYARGDGVNSANIAVAYTPDNGGSSVACKDYNTQTVAASTWTLISCYVTPSGSVTNAQIRITQSSGSATTFYVDALTVTLNSNNANNVQIGGANSGGPVSLLTLDRSSSAPIAANNDAYLGSMYYDTTTGRIQCYEADGWGACGSSPDNIITLTPEYTGAVLNGNGVGVMTADFCANETTGFTFQVGTLCAENEARNFYRWTSPQATDQTYSIYVTYKLPTTFKAFNDSNTIKLTALSDNLTNAEATLRVYRKKADGSGITQCGTSAQTINTSINTWQTKTYDVADETTCSFAGGDNIVFKIEMRSKSNGNIYVENLDFVYTNN